MSTVDTDAVAFVITELEGEGRIVRLTARALPYRPFRISGAQRLEVDWYPGSPEGTGTTLGSKQDPTTLNGMWKDLYIATGSTGVTSTGITPATLNGSSVPNAVSLATLFESIRDEGALLEVSWAHVVRRGYLETFAASYDNVHDVGWEATFNWTSTGRAVGPAAFQQASSSSAATSQFETQRDELAAAIAVPFELPLLPSFVLGLFALVGRVNTSVDQATDVISSLATQTTPPDEVARRTTAVANGIVAQTTDISGLIQRTPSRTLLVGTTPDTQPMGAVIRTASYLRTVMSKALTLKRTAVLSAATIGKALAPGLVATYRPRNGEDLRDVSRIFYGTSFEWRRLLYFNILDSSLLVAGQTILVPQLQSEVRQ